MSVATKNTKKTVRAGIHRVTISNSDKLFWPKEKYTKSDLVNYYDEMSRFVLPYLKNRPLSLKRNPDGILSQGFYHKDAGEKAPSYVDVFKQKSDSSNKVIDYIVCNNKATLLYVVNLGCIEMNPWNSTVKKPDNPDWMVIDIDPSEKNNFKQVVEVALKVKEVLDRAKVCCCCKTSGATGLHVYVPLKRAYETAEVKEFARLIALLVQQELPKTTTVERSINKRNGRIYIDFLQNSKGQTLASAYSVRPVPGACVSTPLEWDEVNEELDPKAFTINTVPERVHEKGDLFEAVLGKGASIEKAIKLLNAEDAGK
ncbi:MAG TPA: non-homologous end-joining DNA ligase [Lacibacter sp.]|jgi:bifunctional non-homologous end joining protein LigD|nr:non-homologous end-joining DNA ligase [Lacibacter sp.]